MSFKGDVAQIPLSNILQALLLNNQEGILTLEAGEVKRKLRVLKQGLRIINHDADTPDLLKSILIKEKILTESQFQNIFSTWTPGSSYPGDFLIARRILTTEAISGRILHQIENIVLELIVNPELRYEFSANADATPFEIFNPETLGEELVLSSNSVLMEALRREDELLRIRQTIPSTSEIFVLADKRGFSSKSIDTNPSFLKEIRPLLTGEYSVSRITTLTTLSSFEVHQTLYQLLNKGLIRTLTLDEKKALSEKLRKSLRPEDAIDTLRSILVAEPTDHASRLKLVSLLEKLKDNPGDLSEQYFLLSDQLRHSDPTRAQGYLKRSLELFPGNLKAIEKLFELYRECGDHKNALASARSVASAARNSEAAPDAIALLYKIINFYPQEPLLFHDLADVHLHARDVDSAISCLQTVAGLHEKTGDLHKLRRTYELLARLKPSESKHLKRLSKLRRKSSIPWRRLAQLSAWFALAAAALIGVSIVGMWEYASRKAFAAVTQDVDMRAKSGDLAMARELLSEFETKFPYSTCIKDAKARMSDINSLVKQKQDKDKAEAASRKDSSETCLTRSKVALDGNDYIKCEELLAQVDFQLLDANRRGDYTSIRGKISSYFDRANELLATSASSEKSQDYAKSHALRKDILTKFPYSRAAVGLLFPVRVETTPPGADILLDGQLVGKTPILLRLPPRKTPSITISKPGYYPFDLSKHGTEEQPYNVSDSYIVTAVLQKAVSWQVPGEGSIEGFPALGGDNVYFGTRNGTIHSLKQSTGEILWTFKIPEAMDFAGGIGVWRNMIYFGSFDGRVYILDATTGKPIHSPLATTTEQLPIKHAASAPSESGIVAVNCDKRLIVAFSLETAKVVWSLSAGAFQFLGQPQVSQGNIYLVTSKGELLEIDHEIGKIKSRSTLGSEFSTRGRIFGNSYFIGSPTGRLVCFDIQKQKIAWAYECGEQISSPPTVDGDWVVVSTVSGKIHCLTTGGEPKWVYTAGEPSSEDFEGTVFRNSLLLGTVSGTVLCLDLWSGGLLWSYKTAGSKEKERRGILSSGVVSKGKFFIGSEDHYLYCFTLD